MSGVFKGVPEPVVDSWSDASQRAETQGTLLFERGDSTIAVVAGVLGMTIAESTGAASIYEAGAGYDVGDFASTGNACALSAGNRVMRGVLGVVGVVTSGVGGAGSLGKLGRGGKTPGAPPARPPAKAAPDGPNRKRPELASEIGGDQPIDPERLARMKAAFERQGGVIDQSPDAQRYLQMRGAEGLTLNERTILLPQNPTTSAVFEEFIHSGQFRRGPVGSSVDLLTHQTC